MNAELSIQHSTMLYQGGPASVPGSWLATFARDGRAIRAMTRTQCGSVRSLEITCLRDVSDAFPSLTIDVSQTPTCTIVQSIVSKDPATGKTLASVRDIGKYIPYIETIICKLVTPDESEIARASFDSDDSECVLILNTRESAPC